MALSVFRLAMVGGLSLWISVDSGIPLEFLGFLAPAWAGTETNSTPEDLIRADQVFEQATNFLENETGAIWLLQQSFENIEHNTIFELMSLGPSYGLIGYPNEGLALIERALALPEADIYRANLLADQSALYQQIEQYDLAIEAARQSIDAAYQLELMYETADTYAAAHGFYQLGCSYFLLGNIDPAIVALMDGLAWLEQSDYPSLKTQILYMLSLAYQAQGDIEKAEQAATDALEIRTVIAEQNGWDINTLDPSKSLEPWDQTLLEVGDAIADIQRAIVTYRRFNQVSSEVNARRYLGNLYQKIGLSTQAQAQFNQAEMRLNSRPRNGE